MIKLNHLFSLPDCKRAFHNCDCADAVIPFSKKGNQ